MEKGISMKMDKKIIILALIILISLLLICKLSNYWYAGNSYAGNSYAGNSYAGNSYAGNSKNKNNFINLFSNTSSSPTGTIPLKYNDIYYYGELNKIPCGAQLDLSNQAQIPCIMRKRCPEPEESKLSANDIALLYSEAYKMAGKEVLNRAITDMKKDEK